MKDHLSSFCIKSFGTSLVSESDVTWGSARTNASRARQKFVTNTRGKYVRNLRVDFFSSGGDL